MMCCIVQADKKRRLEGAESGEAKGWSGMVRDVGGRFGGLLAVTGAGRGWQGMVREEEGVHHRLKQPETHIQHSHNSFLTSVPTEQPITHGCSSLIRSTHRLSASPHLSHNHQPDSRKADAGLIGRPVGQFPRPAVNKGRSRNQG